MEFQRSRIIRNSVKKHSCGECGCKIEPKEEHIYVTGKGDDDFFAYRICEHCSNEYPYLYSDAENRFPKAKKRKKVTVDFKVGGKVNYHSIIGGGITSTGHEITNIGEACGDVVAWITNKSGCVSLEALSAAS